MGNVDKHIQDNEEHVRELAKADLTRSQYIEVLEDLVDQAETALNAAKEDELRTRGEGQTGADSGEE